MNEDFDGFDDLELGNALRRAAGTIPDADAAFGTFQRRVRVARVRRVSAAVASGAAVVAIGAGAFALSGRSTPPVTPADRGITLDTVADSTIPDSTIESVPGTNGTPSGTTGPSGTSTGPTGAPSSATTLPGGGSSHEGSDDHHDGATSTTEPDDDHEDGAAASPTTAPAVSASKRCTSAYGSFTAVRAQQRVRLQDVVPAAGYSVQESEQGDSSAMVIFRSEETEATVEALWNGAQFACSVQV